MTGAPPSSSSLPASGASAAEEVPTLPEGTRVAEFEVKGVLGSGGFGIVYRAWDHALEREVALKEYMPGNLAGRGEGLAVSVRSSGMADTFALGLRSFVNEARLLARFDHPSLVKVYRFWEDNGTAYMVMPRYLGRTLRQVRAGMVVPPGEAACRRVLDALLSALEVLHKEGVFHRDIAPDNILLGDDGAPVLLDFGAARRVIGEGGKALTSIMKPHFAPLEQYADQSAMRQGPWTDLYALGGTLYFLVTGREPVPAASRALHDDQPRLADLRPGDFSHGFLAAIDWMLALKPAERPQSVHMLRDVLEGRLTLPARTSPDRTVPGVAAREGVDILTSPGELIDTAAPEPVPAAQRTMVLPSAPAPEPVPSPAAATPPAAPAAAAATPRRPLLLVLGMLVLLNILAWWWFTRPEPETAPAPASAATAPTAAPTAAPAPAVVPPPESAAAASVPDEPTETILSVLPARVPRPPAAASAAAPLPGAATATPATTLRSGDLPSVPPVPARVQATAAQAAVDARGPRARCGDRNFLALLVCMKRECDAPALASHPECVKMREQEEAAHRSAR